MRILLLHRLRSFAALVFAATFAALCPAAAQTEDVFTVPRVPVQARAATASEARSVATIEGRRRAMDILLRRLTVEADWPYLPLLAAGQAAQAAAGPDGKSPVSIGPETLVGLESGFVVYGEKSSAETYRAEITYRFRPESVRRLLREARLPYSEAQTGTALVLPVLETAKSVYLWEANNPWMAAWKARPFTHELTPMTAPLGDLEDVARINARQALARDPAALKELAAHYNVPQIIVAHARLAQANGENVLRVQLINAYRESAKLPVADAVQTAIDLAQGPDAPPASPPPEEFGGQPGSIIATVSLTGAAGDFPGLAEQAIERSIAGYSRAWKERTLIDYAKEAVLEGTAFFTSIDEWSRIRSALIETQLVGAVQIASLSKRGAEMQIRVYGDPQRLATTLENRGVSLWSETGERWFLATPATARGLRGQRFLTNPGRRRFGEADGEAAINEAAFDASAPEDAAGAYDQKISQ